MEDMEIIFFLNLILFPDSFQKGWSDSKIWALNHLLSCFIEVQADPWGCPSSEIY